MVRARWTAPASLISGSELRKLGVPKSKRQNQAEVQTAMLAHME